MVRWIIFILVLLLIEFYAFQAFRTLIKTRWILASYQLMSLLLVLFIIYSFTQFDRSVGQMKQTLLTLGLVLLIYIPKILIMVVLFSEDIFRLFRGALNYFYSSDVDTSVFPARRKFVSQVA